MLDGTSILLSQYFWFWKLSYLHPSKLFPKVQSQFYLNQNDMENKPQGFIVYTTGNYIQYLVIT